MPRDAASIRRRIKAELITDRLQEHILVEPCMTQSQVAAGIALLNKVSPNLKSIDLTIEGRQEISVKIIQFSELEKAPVIDVTPEALPEAIPAPEMASIEEMIG